MRSDATVPIGANGGRLSVLDGSFLRMDSAHVQMQMGFCTVFAPPSDRPRPSVEALRERAAGRIDEVPWCQWKLDVAPLGLSEPRWIADHEFDLRAHIVALTTPEDRVTQESFEALRDMFFSAPLDRTRPLWQFSLVPRLHDGRVAVIGKVHHSLVDGIGAMQFAKLIFDGEPFPEPPVPPSSSVSPWRPGTRAGRIGWTVDSITQTIDAGVGALREAATALANPQAAADRVLRRAKLMAGTVRDDVLPAAPASVLNAKIGSRRTLVGYHPRREDLLAARANGGTFNDIGLAIVAGALRRLALDRDGPPDAPMRASIPVSTREIGDTAAGNQFALVNIPLPTHLTSPRDRLEHVRGQMRLLKYADRTAAAEELISAAAFLPPPLRSPVVRALSGPRQFNLMVSNTSAPRGSLYVLGCEMEEVYFAIPITQGHTLAIGLSRYRQELFIACYADPDTLPEVHDLPALMDAELRALAPAASPAAPPAGPR
jgi:diacylglycerol O-acyltransferase